MYRLINTTTKETIKRSKTPPTLDGSQPIGLDPAYAWVREIPVDIPTHDSRIFKVETTEAFDLDAFTITPEYNLARRQPEEIVTTLVSLLHQKQDLLLPSRSRERLMAACLFECIKAAWPNLADAPDVIQSGLQILAHVETNEEWFASMEAKANAGTITSADLDS